jgi:CotH kinase protein/Malectin domain/FlgD Ig-like domain/Lamin Tail Domain
MHPLRQISPARTLRALLASAGLLAVLALSSPAAAYEIHVNAGGGPYAAEDGTPFVTDRVYTTGSYGYIEGFSPQPTWHAIGNTEDAPLYRDTRNGFAPIGNLEYRFDVPNGPYLVTLHLSENFKHSTGDAQFDVFFEGAQVLSNIDVYALVQGTYAIDFTLPATVSDGVLNVLMDADLGVASLSAISVISRAPDAAAPAVPTGVVAAHNYLGVALNWETGPEDDLSGWQVERATNAGGPFTLITPSLVRVSRYMDPVASGGPYYYRIKAVDAFNNTSAPSTPVVNASPLNHNASALPLVHILIDAESLEFLNDLPSTDTYVPCQIAFDNQLYPTATCRYRGNISRSLNKKSWKVKLGAGAMFEGRETFNFNAEYIDKSLMRSALSYELLSRAGCPSPDVRFIHTVVNNAWTGVRTDIENVDSEFLTRVGLASGNANLYKPIGTAPPGNLSILNSVQDYQAAYEKELGDPDDYSDLIELIQGLNLVGEDSTFHFLAARFDLNRFLDFYTSQTILQNTDLTFKNWYLHHDLDTDRWTLIPWDVDLTFGNLSPFSDFFSTTQPIYVASGNRLFNKVPSLPILRQLHFDRIRQLFATSLSPGAFVPLMDSTFALIETDTERDWWKWGWEENDWFHDSPAEIEGFLTGRTSYLNGQIAALETESALAINELQAANQTTVTDEWGDFDDWVEIVNRGSAPVSLDGLYLTDDLTVPGKFAFPDTTLPPGGHALVWCDLEPSEGPWHANFKLEQSDEEVGLFAGPLVTSDPIDVRVYDDQLTDASFGRLPDGGPLWKVMATPTPGDPNVGGGNLRPQITNVRHFPPAPPANSPVTVTADLWDDGTLTQTQLRYDVGSGFVNVNLLDDGLHGDGGADDGKYGGVIPGQPSLTLVRYYVRAVDNLAAISLDPPGAPDVTHSFTTGYVPPPLKLNELMAQNSTTIADPADDDFEDWLEIWNAGQQELTLSGMHLTDLLTNPTKWVFPQGVSLPAGEFLIVWCDEEGGQGPLHANFKLSVAGEEVGLFDTVPLGVGLIDTVHFGQQTNDVSYGRFPDGGAWRVLAVATPGETNGTIGVGEDGGLGAAPRVVALRGPFPNPMAPGAALEIDLPASATVELKVYDVTGREVRRLLQSPMAAGRHRATWDGKDTRGARVASGVYWFRLKAAGEVREARALLLR